MSNQKSSSAGLIAILLKLGPKIGTFGLKMLKGLKAGKVFFAAASLATYSYMFTWQFACLLLLMLFVHESGHIWAMRRCGMAVKGIYFIPFFGAAAVSEESFKSFKDESFIAIMGPIWGLALAVLAAIAYVITQSPFFAAVASWMAMINLFNLMPINPLDGGRIAKSIAFSLHSVIGFGFMFIGFGSALYIATVYKVGIFGFLVFIGGLELLIMWGKNRKPGQRQFDKIFRTEHRYTQAAADTKIMMQGLAGEKEELIRAQAWQLALCMTIEKMEKRLAEFEASHIPTMNRGQMVRSMTAYLLVASVLFGIMVQMKHIPGAAAAMEILEDAPDASSETSESESK